MTPRRGAVRTIAFTAYPARDVPGTRAWYERVLGLRFAGPYCEDGVEKYDEAHLPEGASFGLMAPEWVGRDAGLGAGVAFEVDDLDALVERLRADGIAIDDPGRGPVCKQTSLCDPEGNRIVLHERTA